MQCRALRIPVGGILKRPTYHDGFYSICRFVSNTACTLNSTGKPTSKGTHHGIEPKQSQGVFESRRRSARGDRGFMEREKLCANRGRKRSTARWHCGLRRSHERWRPARLPAECAGVEFPDCGCFRPLEPPPR